MKDNNENIKTEVMNDVNTVLPVVTSENQIAKIEHEQLDVLTNAAKNSPRSIEKVTSEVVSIATIDKETAESCYYVLKRKSKDGKDVYIVGPSVRLAEIFLHSWRNTRLQVYITEIGDRIRAVANIIDLERGIAVSREVIRRGTNKFGQLMSDDMLIMTANAAMAIAKRNAIFDLIPRAIVNQTLERIKGSLRKKGQSIEKAREEAIKYFESIGIPTEKILQWLEVEKVEDIKEEQLENLRGLATALRDGETTIKEEFDI